MVDMSQMALTLAEGEDEPCLMRKSIRQVDLGAGILLFGI